MLKKNMWVSCLRAMGSWLLKLRYRIDVRGLDAIAARGTRGILFLPNHPALIDPVILIAILHRTFSPYILADRDRIDAPVLRSLPVQVRTPGGPAVEGEQHGLQVVRPQGRG